MYSRDNVNPHMINFLLWEQNISTRMDKGSKNPISLTVQRREEGELLSCPEKKSRVFLLLEPKEKERTHYI